MSFIVEDKIKKINYSIEGVNLVKEWHLWNMDKSHRIMTIDVEVAEDANLDLVQSQIQKKFSRYSEELYIHLSKG